MIKMSLKNEIETIQTPNSSFIEKLIFSEDRKRITVTIREHKTEDLTVGKYDLLYVFEKEVNKKGFIASLKDSWNNIMNSPEYSIKMTKAADECKANMYLSNNNLGEFRNKGMTLEEAKNMVKKIKEEEKNG